MTNEDIEATIIKRYGSSLPGLMPVIRDAVLQAYEEAAQKALEMKKGWASGAYEARQALDEASKAILDLRGSLSETVSKGE